MRSPPLTTAELRRERRRITGILRRESLLCGYNAGELSERCELHKNSIYRLWAGEDARLSSYQKLARALGLRLFLQESDSVLPLPESVMVECPTCCVRQDLPPGDNSGRATCRSCGGLFLVRKVVTYDTFPVETDDEEQEAEEDQGR